MTLVIPSNEYDASEIFGTRGFNSGGASKIGAIIQGSRLAYRTGKFAYKRYFGYATKTRSRQIGTATGAGIGISGGLVAILKQKQLTPTNRFGQTRSNMVRPKRRLQRCYVKTTHRPRTTWRR